MGPYKEYQRLLQDVTSLMLFKTTLVTVIKSTTVYGHHLIGSSDCRGLVMRASANKAEGRF